MTTFPSRRRAADSNPRAFVLFAITMTVACTGTIDDAPSAIDDGTTEVAALSASCEGFGFPDAPPPGKEVWRWGVLVGPQTRGLAFDSARGRIVTGGESGTAESVDGATTSEVHPTAPGDGRLVYDPVDGAVIMYTPSGETWRWDGATWTQLATTGPGPRHGQAIVWDPLGQRVLMFGGKRPDQAYPLRNDLWSWDGAQWSPVPQPGLRPPGDRRLSMTFDAASDRVILAAGEAQEFWSWDGTSWTKEPWAHPENPVGNWPGGAIGYDPIAQRLVMFSNRRAYVQTDDGWAERAVYEKKADNAAQVIWDPVHEQFVVLNTTTGVFRLSRGMAANKRPELEVVEPQAAKLSNGLRVRPGEVVAVAVSATDPEGDVLSYAALGLPGGASFVDGELSWQPQDDQLGVHDISLAVSDGGKCDRIDFQVTVVDPMYDGLSEGTLRATGSETVISKTRQYKSSGSSVDHGEVQATVHTQVWGTNPGTLMLAAQVRAPYRYYAGSPYGAVWTGLISVHAEVPVEPDLTFEFWAGSTGLVDDPWSWDYACAYVKGRLVPEAEGQLQVEIDILRAAHTSCAGAASKAHTVGPIRDDSYDPDLQGYALSGEPIESEVGLPGKPLAWATFWHPVQQRYYVIDTPLWSREGGSITTLDGTHLGYRTRVPTLDASITGISVGDDGQVIVEY